MQLANWLNAITLLVLGAVHVIAWGLLPLKPRRGKAGDEYWGWPATLLFIGLVFLFIGVIYVYGLVNLEVSLIGGSAMGTATLIALEALGIGALGASHLCSAKRSIRTLQKQGFAVSEDSPLHVRAVRSMGLVLVLVTIALVASWVYALWPLLRP